MVKYIAKIGSGAETYYLKDIEARASIDDKPSSDDFENLGDALTIQTVDDAIAEANKEDSVISFDTDTANVGEGETLTKAVVITAGDGAVTYISSDTDIATVDNNGVVIGISAGTCIITANIASTSSYRSATASYTVTVVYNPYGGHDYVEIAGIKWATMNIGASSVTDYGNYYQYGKGSAQYAATSGDSDYSGTENPLAESADTATQEWGGQWHMPTKAQFESLMANTNCTWETDYQGSGINGGLFTDKNDSSKKLFFPAAGYWRNGSHDNVGTVCYCRSSTPNSSSYAYYLYLYSGSVSVGYGYRNQGCSVRPVVG